MRLNELHRFRGCSFSLFSGKVVCLNQALGVGAMKGVTTFNLAERIES
jgi:hypothetical protein